WGTGSRSDSVVCVPESGSMFGIEFRLGVSPGVHVWMGDLGFGSISLGLEVWSQGLGLALGSILGVGLSLGPDSGPR
uniref:Uncharacterized protein n=1 Tax=Cannabis sativa TaxID=3483 RepID=A0A803QRU3_CANSA